MRMCEFCFWCVMDMRKSVGGGGCGVCGGWGGGGGEAFSDLAHKKLIFGQHFVILVICPQNRRNV